MEWSSRKQKRTARSSLIAETLAAAEVAVWVKSIWEEITGSELKFEVIVDSRTLFQLTCSTKMPQERRLLSELNGLRKDLALGLIEMVWVSDVDQLADGLTKHSGRVK